MLGVSDAAYPFCSFDVIISTGTRSARARARALRCRGRLVPLSQAATVLAETRTRRASSSCVSPRSRRRSPILAIQSITVPFKSQGS
jgi:hypothetical protein